MKPTRAFSLLDVETLRLALLGSSVIDWLRLPFTTREEVDHFLRLCRIDPDSTTDGVWIRSVLADAVGYLRESLGWDIPAEIAEPTELHDLFFYASGAKAPQLRRLACTVLKVCHVIYHIEARDLYHRVPLSEESFGELATAQITAAFEQMKLDGFPISTVDASAKTRASLISKLLQKSDTLAARIYDRTRFRVIVGTRDDVLPVLHGLIQRLFPFHLVVPGQTQNSLVDFARVAATTPEWAPFLGELQFGVDFLDQNQRTSVNEFTGTTYQMLKLVVDMPLRINEALISPEVAATTRSRAVCCLVEIQIVDAETLQANERGDNGHARYKERQRVLINHRLARGLAASFTRKPGT